MWDSLPLPLTETPMNDTLTPTERRNDRSKRRRRQHQVDRLERKLAEIEIADALAGRIAA